MSIRYGVHYILQDCYDPTNHALRVTYSEPDIPIGKRLDFEQVMEALYVPALHALRIKDPIAGSGTDGSKLDPKQIIKNAFNLATGKLVVVG